MHAIGGYYEWADEALLDINGECYLVLYGISEFDNTCCGVGGGGFAHVVGSVTAHRIDQDEHGRAVSMVIPVSPAQQRGIESRVRANPLVSQVSFFVA